MWIRAVQLSRSNAAARSLLSKHASSLRQSTSGSVAFRPALFVQSRKESTTTPQPSFQQPDQEGSRPSGRGRRVRRWIVWGVVIGGSAVLTYELYNAKNPPPQLPWDHTKKTVAILGSGWAATSILKDLDTENWNVVCISPRNYFLFTPLLPSCTVGTIELRSIMQPIRYMTRLKKREVMFIEGECTEIDPESKVITVQDNSELVGAVSKQSIPYDVLIVACGAENATFGIPGVKENACFLKETWDARKIRTRLMDCLETAAFPGQPESEVQRLLHMVVVGGGPTGVEYAAELHDFLNEDLVAWYPEMAGKIKITLIEALPHVLPMFSKQLIEYTETTFAENKVDILNNTMVKEVRPKELVVLNKEKQIETIPYGLLVWATGNTARPVVTSLIKQLDPALQNQRRGLVVDDHLRVKGASMIYALGDASATKYAPTAQVASRQGRFLAHHLNMLADAEKCGEADLPKVAEQLPTFSHESAGMLAYIGADRAIADLPGSIRIGGFLTYYFWRSAYLSNLITWRNRFLVASDWIKKSVFGRDIGRE
ncbi:NADH:ubiquinone oxidoreductase [Quaeritorhiza haematococci]|nr:NADH:ubiquinone oxidoreductase [Quaeritorhiza haematococci]